jgi:hypothetical protein
MLKENLQDAALIVNNILVSPLEIKGATGDVTLIGAATHFRKEEWEDSDLRKILLSFLSYPRPTKMLVTELELLLNDLK